MFLIFAVFTFSILCEPIIGLDVAAPKSYDISFDLVNSRESREFSGVAHIEFECLEQSSKLILNCKNLDIDASSASITSDLEVEAIIVDNETEVCEIKLSGNLEVGVTYTIEMDFKGKINSEVTGIFDESYTEDYTRKL